MNSHAWALFQFRLIAEGVFLPTLLPLTIGEGPRMEFLTPNWSEEEWGNHQFGDPHHWWSTERRTWAWWQFSATPIRPRWRPAMPSLHSMPTLIFWQPSVAVVMARYSNTPYISWRTSHSLFLDVGTLSGGASSAQFPLDRLCLYWLIPFLQDRGAATSWRGERKAGNVPPYLPEILWESSEEEHYLSDPISLSVPNVGPSSTFRRGHQEEGMQMEGGSGYHPALKLLQDINQARAQLEYELIQETQEFAERYEHKWAKHVRRHARRGHRWLIRPMPPSRRYFPRWVWQWLSSYCPSASLWQCLSAT